VALNGYIIPFACFLGILSNFIKKDALRNLAKKLAVFGLILFAAIPASIHVSDLLYDNYQASIQQTIDTEEQNMEYIEDKKEDFSKEDQNLIEKFEKFISNVTSKIGNDISTMANKGDETLFSFLDAIAILIITTCVIPIVVILIFAWAIKIIFGFDTLKAPIIYREKTK
jgi:predicted PurR-regulated permease PerM